MAANKGSGELNMPSDTHWRAKKNAAIAAANQERAKTKAIDPKIDKTHWRYRKNLAITKHGTTKIADVVPPPAKKETPKPKPIIKKLTEKEAYKLIKSEQIALIKKLGGTIFPPKEKGRVEVILKLQED